MKDIEKVIYMVKCPFDTSHKFPVQMEKSEEKKEAGSRFEAYCPFCAKYSQVTIEEELKPNEAFFRGFGVKEKEESS